jgi:hexosaminidase
MGGLHKYGLHRKIAHMPFFQCMKRKSPVVGIILGAILTANSAIAAANIDPAIIPLPQKMELREGTFKLAPDTKIIAGFQSLATAEQMAATLRKSTGYKLEIERADASPLVANCILLTTNATHTNLGAEGYELTVAPDSVVIGAPTEAGLFYGAQTLLQLLPPDIFSPTLATNEDWQMPCVQIEDWPRFKWRGLMLDVSRHFYNKSEVETILDAMALHKLNTFHWHLTDDQGWRIEIKKYPRLTEIGAWRPGVGFNLDPKSTTAYSAGGRYGGFYTQEDIREVVKYAAARHITIVPEIEMPGHASAALAAYPQFSCTGGPFEVGLMGGVFKGIYDPANEATFTFLDDVLTEVFQLFPGKYVHIGGDEVPKDTWKNSPDCQALMRREGLKNEEELQSWFVRRIEKFISAHGHVMIGWSEILQGGLAQNAVVMDWIGGATEASSSGHDVVMTPTGYCYLDQYQSSNRAGEPHAIGGYISLEKCYSFEPASPDMPQRFESHILGGQGNLWTEYIPNLNYAEYMIFPRETALAEIDWSAATGRSFADFLRRLQVQDQRYDELGVNYRRYPMNVAETDPIK